MKLLTQRTVLLTLFLTTGVAALLFLLVRPDSHQLPTGERVYLSGVGYGTNVVFIHCAGNRYARKIAGRKSAEKFPEWLKKFLKFQGESTFSHDQPVLALQFYVENSDPKGKFPEFEVTVSDQSKKTEQPTTWSMGSNVGVASFYWSASNFELRGKTLNIQFSRKDKLTVATIFQIRNPAFHQPAPKILP